MKPIANRQVSEKKEKLPAMLKVKTSIKVGRSWQDQSKMTWVNQSDPLACRTYSTNIV